MAKSNEFGEGFHVKLEDLPEEVKPIGCKCIYKRKRGVVGKVETFKARLVVKSYTVWFFFHKSLVKAT